MATSQMIPWERLAEASDVSSVIRDFLPERATVSEFDKFAEEQGLEHSDRIDDIVYGSAPAASEVDWAAAKWLMKFHFVGERLVLVDVEKGYISP